jgi:hypothetical protein
VLRKDGGQPVCDVIGIKHDAPCFTEPCIRRLIGESISISR